MSRLGRLPIQLPSGISFVLEGTTMTVTGPRGTLTETLPEAIDILQVDQELRVAPNRSLTRQTKPLYGLIRQLLANMVQGVSSGFTKKLEMKGTGYRAEVQENHLVLHVGFSHPVQISRPDGITFGVEKNVLISIEGNNKQVVGAVAAKIRSIRKPDPYKGKGIRYQGEVIRLKPGKAAKAQSG